MPFLEGKLIFLRGLCSEDADGGYPLWFNSDDINKHNSHHRHPYSRTEAISYIEALSEDRTKLVLAIVDKDTNRHIGNVALQDINNINRSANLAIIIGEKDFWGRGIAVEASRLIISHGFFELNLHRIDAGTSSENASAIAWLEKLGFIKEGHKRRAHYKNGCYHDILEYGILREEWEEWEKLMCGAEME